MAEIDVHISGPSSLKQQWAGQIRHGLLFAPLSPAPAAGAPVDLRLIARWAGARISIRGQVEQNQGGISIVRLAPLDDAARQGFIALGIEEARTASWAAQGSAPVGTRPATAPGMPAAPSSASMPAASPRAAPPSPAPAPAPAVPPSPAAIPAPAVAQAAPAPSPHPAPPMSPPTSPMPSVAGPPSHTAMASPGPLPSPGTPPPAMAPRTMPSMGSMPSAGGFRPMPSVGSMPSVPPGLPVPTSGVLHAVGGPVPGAGPGVPVNPAAPQGAHSGDWKAIAGSGGPGRAGTEALLPAATEQGDLGTMSWRDVLLHFATRRSTGVLVIRGFREVRWCYLIDGQPVHYRGDQPHAGEFLFDALAQEVQMPQEEWAHAMRMQQVTGLPAGEYLVARGRISRTDLDAALNRRAARITKYLLGANFGRFSFHPLDELRTVFHYQPVNVLVLLMDAQRQTYAQLDDDALIRKAEPLYPLHIRPVADRWSLIPMLPLSDMERHLCEAVLPAGWPLKEMVALRELDEKSLVRFVFSLMGLGVLEAVREEGAAGRRNRAERKLFVALKDMRRRNEFEALHSHWSSIAKEIRAGYDQVLTEFGRAAYAEFMDPRIEGLLAEIRRRADECWGKLETAAGRKATRLESVGNDQLRMASDLLDKQGEMALFKGDFPLAKSIYTRVLELDPGGVEGAENTTRAKAMLADPRIDQAAEVAGAGVDGLRRQFDTLVDGE